MNDFLSNLTARSLGTADVIGPRVPSLFEPYRRDSGPPPVRTSFGSQETDPESAHANGLVSAGKSAALMPEARLADTFEAHEMEKPGRVSLSSRAKAPLGSAGRVDSPKHSEGPGESVVGQTRQSAAPNPDLSRPQLRPTELVTPVVERAGIPKIPAGMRVSIPSDLSGESDPQAAFHEPIVPKATTRPESADSLLVKPSEARRVNLDGSHHELSRRRLAGELASSATELRHSSAGYSERSATSAIRPPFAPRSEMAQVQAAARHSKPSEPAIQVTIGKVEVRAIFPEGPTRRVAPARPLRTVSLDDYLKGSTRGPR